MKLTLRILSATTLLFALMGLVPYASAANIPCRVARLIVPWSPGGETDIIMRAYVNAVNAEGAKPHLQVVNISGQGGNKGAKEARKAKPDGCTLLAIHQSVILSYLTGRIDFSWNAFEPVALLARDPEMIIAKPSTPYNNLKQLVAYAKKHPDHVTAGVTLGSTPQFVYLLVSSASGGAKFRLVPYDGTRARVTALLAGNIDTADATYTVAKPYLKSGKVKALGYLSDQRSPHMPNVPTAKEQGIDVTFGTDRGVVLPKGTPKSVRDHYIKLFRKATHSSKLKQDLSQKGVIIKFLPGKRYRNYFEKTQKQLVGTMKQNGLKPSHQ